MRLWLYGLYGLPLLIEGFRSRMRCPQSFRFWFQPPVGAPLPQSFVLLLVPPQRKHYKYPYPLDQGGQKIVILLFSRVGGVKNVILQYSILREKCNLTFFGTMGKLKNVSYESSGWQTYAFCRHIQCRGFSTLHLYCPKTWKPNHIAV